MWWPLGARMAMALARRGCHVSAVCPKGHPLCFVSGVASLYPYKRFGSAQSLRAAILDSDPELIVPCDDAVVWQLHELYAGNPKLRELIERSIGSGEYHATIQKRGEVLQAAAELGIRIPFTQVVSSIDELRGWCLDAPAVLKLDGTWGGEGVVIARTPDGAKAAFQKLSKPDTLLRAWKRLLINRDLISLWSRRKRKKSSVTVQQFVQGRPANTMFACWNGEVLASLTVEVLAAQSATGAATVVRLIKNEEIDRASELLAKRFKLSGFHGLDFILEELSGAAFLIELNPRCTQLGHLNVRNRGSLAESICTKLGCTLSAEVLSTGLQQDVAVGTTVAFFPQALKWNSTSEYLHRGMHDVPWEELALVQELLRKSWPERQWLSKIYHSFRTPKLPEEVSFRGTVPVERPQGQKYSGMLNGEASPKTLGKKTASKR